ncbi:serine carboxypeptidase-like 51 isoform X2 [Panicum virgatum]|uniref:Carboxypeptidase n=1 Tax=Panicum virgatum TaxID=38727 RepID=A0A8T0QDB8_PANVG|nr:serine carboxypeptidase-like 51 isoform X2 [Panicum virgatum]KAG2571198.1 hypothetical protein PVAP13_7KG119145 [Panicum virgatum]
METSAIAFLCLLCIHGAAAITAGTQDGMQLWGYATPRPKVNIFWWWYRSPNRVSSVVKPWPTILWLQGGPGGSASGRGNFLEIGPLDLNMNPRNFTWLSVADIIFVDSPVGVGFSYADDPSALVKTDSQTVVDLVGVIKVLLKKLSTLKSSPLFLVGESYGGKIAAMVGVSLSRAIRNGTIINLKLGGVVIGDGWISPEDYALSYAQLLHDVSRLNDNAVGDVNKMAVTVREQVAAGQFATAQKTWTNQLDLIDSRSDSVNMDNFLLDTGMNPVLANWQSMTSSQLMCRNSQQSQSAPNNIDDVINRVIKPMLKIIPKKIVWEEATLQVYENLANDFMKPAINEVDKLLADGVNVTVYNGQLDVICPTVGVEAWVNKLKWFGLSKFLSLPRQPLHYCDSAIYCSKQIRAFVRSYKNFTFYWILQAGHMVPVDQPYPALRMIASATLSPGN